MTYILSSSRTVFLWLVASGVVWSIWTARAQSPVPPLTVQRPDHRGWIHLASPGTSDRVHTLDASGDLRAWTNIAVLHDGPFDFADAQSSGQTRRFYRLSSRIKTSSDDGKNQVLFPTDPFLSDSTGPGEEPRWVKFAILLSDPHRVWFQKSNPYLFHYDYAVRRLPQFVGMTRAEFDAVSLRTNRQQVVLGAVLYPWSPFGVPSTREFGIQFVGLDAYRPEQVVNWFHLVEAAVLAESPGARAYYMPTVEQNGAALQNRDYFEQQGVPISQADRWLRGNIIYSSGWALGRLVFVPAGEIDAAYADGRLKPSDVLLTDGVPAEVPYVAGIICLVPATPNSHVAILARSYHIPFAFIASPEEQAQLRALAGREIQFRTNESFNQVKAAVVDVDLSPALRAEILALKSRAPIHLTPKASFGAFSTNVDTLTPADLKFFGGKASNFGFLRRTVPTNSPPAIAFAFDLWDAFLDQKLPNSTKTLRQEIRDRTAGFTYPPDITAVRATLSDIRDLIRKTATFDPGQRQAILQALEVFEPGRKIRFRSSTNVEDSEQFTGAGLYDSYSGCLLDDLDDNSAGPSACDPSEPEERGVFRAIQRVYASFYNDNAWLERLRQGLNEDQFGMAVLAHHSFPDPEELANGVATVSFQRSEGGFSFQAQLVTQLGAASVTNPEDGAKPEIASAFGFAGGRFVDLRQQSSLVPLGDHVMNWTTDYTSLLALFERVAVGYGGFFPAKLSFTLDFEFKKVQSGALEVKQVRELVEELPSHPTEPFLLNEPTELSVVQGEFGDIFAIHRLKSRWSLATTNLKLTKTNLTASFYTNAVEEFVHGSNLVQLTNGFAHWPDAEFIRTDDGVEDRWSYGAGDDLRRFSLQTTITTEADALLNPLLTQRDLRRVLRVTYAKPMPALTWEGPTTTTSDSVQLGPVIPVTSSSLLQTRTLQTKSEAGATVQTSFYWPEPPRGPTAGYTAPLIAWVESRISGLTKEPIVLRGDYSQSYHPGHHNFFEEFLFEPQLESGISAAQLAELQAANIQLILATKGDSETKLTVIGFDGKMRQL